MTVSIKTRSDFTPHVTNKRNFKLLNPGFQGFFWCTFPLEIKLKSPAKSSLSIEHPITNADNKRDHQLKTAAKVPRLAYYIAQSIHNARNLIIFIYTLEKLKFLSSFTLRSNWLLSSIELTFCFDRNDLRSKQPSIETTRIHHIELNLAINKLINKQIPIEWAMHSALASVLQFCWFVCLFLGGGHDWKTLTYKCCKTVC